MNAINYQAERFEANRGQLEAVAYRILGSRSEAQDAVQECWLRLARADAAEIENLAAWLTTVVARVCLDVLRARKARTAEDLSETDAETGSSNDDPAHQQEIADSVGHALLVILDALAPSERVAFVLHDVFDLTFDDIAAIIRRSPAATRQLASRARRRVRGTPAPEGERARQREVVAAFMAASREGNLAAIIATLDPEVVLHADSAIIHANAARPDAPVLQPRMVGLETIAGIFKGRAQAAVHALIDGIPGLVFAPAGQPRGVLEFVVEDDRIVEIGVIGDPGVMATMQLSMEA